MKNVSKPLRLLVAFCLILAFALPAASAETVTGNIYGQTEMPVMQEINVTVTAADAQLTVSFPKMLVNGTVPDLYEITILPEGPKVSAEPYKIGSAEMKSDTVTYVAKKLKNNSGYSISVNAKQADGIILGWGSGFGKPSAKVVTTPKPAAPPAMKGAKAVAGKGEVKVSFDKITGKADTYQIHWWIKTDKSGQPVYEKPIIIKAANVKKNNHSYTFKKLKAGTTYHFNVFAADSKKKTLGLTMDLTATVK